MKERPAHEKKALKAEKRSKIVPVAKTTRETVFVVSCSLWNRRRWHTWGTVREVVSVGVWYYHSDSGGMWGSSSCVCFWGAMLCKTRMVSQLHTWQNILSLSTEGLLYRGLPVVLRECEKHLSVCCGLTTSSHPIMDLGWGPSAVLSKHYFWW